MILSIICPLFTYKLVLGKNICHFFYFIRAFMKLYLLIRLLSVVCLSVLMSVYFLAHLIKTFVSFSDRLSTVCLSVCMLTIHIFIFFRKTTSISSKLGTKHFWVKGIQVQMKDHIYIQGEMITN